MRIITGKITIEHHHFHPFTYILLTPEARTSEMEGIFIQPLLCCRLLVFSSTSLTGEIASILC
jgi:hypothetical protein